MPDFSNEARLIGRHGGPVAGLDEAGRGPWAGPVIAAAAVLDPAKLDPALIAEIDDSKKLCAARREKLAELLFAQAKIGLGEASVAEIDRLNILQATFLAMQRALVALGLKPGAVLVDGKQAPDFGLPTQTLIKGDGLSLSIAAASICAKVTRDRIMRDLARRHPGFAWDQNKGYGTKAHQEGLARLGPSPEHRRSFAPVRKLLCATSCVPDRLEHQ